MKVKQGKIIKEVPENLVSLYLTMGWELYKEKKFEVPIKKENKEEKTEE